MDQERAIKVQFLAPSVTAPTKFKAVRSVYVKPDTTPTQLNLLANVFNVFTKVPGFGAITRYLITRHEQMAVTPVSLLPQFAAPSQGGN